MVELLRNIVIGFVLFATLISLVVISHTGLQHLYGIPDTDIRDGKNVGQTLKDLSLVQQLNKTITDPTDLKIPTGSFLDVVGSLAASGIGALKTIASIIALPVEIFGVITNFYYIPPVFVSAIITIITIIIGFILLSKYIGSEI